MVARKLASIYGDNYKFELQQNDWGLEVFIEIPFVAGVGAGLC